MIVTDIGDLERFKQSTIYGDMMREFQTFLNSIHLELENPPDGDGRLRYSSAQLHRLGGNAEAVRRCAKIIDVLIEHKKIELEEEAKIKRERRNSHG